MEVSLRLSLIDQTSKLAALAPNKKKKKKEEENDTMAVDGKDGSKEGNGSGSNGGIDAKTLTEARKHLINAEKSAKPSIVR